MANQPRFEFRVRFSAFALAILCALLISASQTGRAQTYSVLHTFTYSDGAYPTSTLVADRAGDFYGTTENGGSHGYGTVFQIKRAGSGYVLRPLQQFGQPASNGKSPIDYGGLTFATDGTIYGSTSSGARCGIGGGDFCGVVFRLQPPPTACTSALCPWDYSLVYQFTPSVVPQTSLVFDAGGNLYGTGGGTIYELSPSGGSWNESVIYRLNDDTNDGMIMDSTGNLYGTWWSYDNSGGVFELTPSASGWTETVLYNFTGGNDGSSPLGGLIFDTAGNLYGSTSTGGSQGGGAVFELSPSGGGWTYNFVCSLRGYSAMSGPQSALAMDNQGNLYGTTYTGGGFGAGEVFKATRTGNNWTCSDLYDFQVGTDGFNPIAGVTLDSQGNLYGTTSVGGDNSACPGGNDQGCGVVWEITP